MNGFVKVQRRVGMGWCALVAGVVTVAPTPGAAQTPDSSRVDIQGRVLDGFTRRPLPGVAVHIAEFDVNIRTDSTGVFMVRGIPLGTYELSLALPGYRPASGGFAVMRAGSFVTTLTPAYVGEVVEVERTGHFVGRLVDDESGRPIAGADVQVAGLYLGAVTDDDGRFRIDAVPPGRHPVEFSQLGYAARTDTVQFAAGQTSDARVRLSRDPIEIAPIEVTVERRELVLMDQGFYQRRERGYGSFIDIEIIRQRRPEEITDVFNGLPGVDIIRAPLNPLARAVLLRAGRTSTLQTDQGNCYPTLVVDGLIRHFGGQDPTYVDQFVDPSEVAGIEVYQSQLGVPIEYSRDAACGAILVWTRR